MDNIYNFTQDELNIFFESKGIKPIKSRFVYNALYRDFADDLSNIPFVNPKFLINEFYIELPEIVDKNETLDAVKFLLKLKDGNYVEAVIMRHDYGCSICISTQVGCNMGCKFCQSGRLKKVRNLETSEMVGQIIAINKELNENIKHVVLMGIGEPFDNYDNVMNFIDIISNDNGLAIGKRHITVSTCGIVPKISNFLDRKNKVNLAISLHAPNDKIRSALMPINKTYSIGDIMSAFKGYKGRISFEYLMLDGINDSEDNAIELANLVSPLNCYVNLIPYNETENSGFTKSSKDKISRFFDILKQNKILVTVRREFGGELKAACGQLRAEKESQA